MGCNLCKSSLSSYERHDGPSSTTKRWDFGINSLFVTIGFGNNKESLSSFGETGSRVICGRDLDSGRKMLNSYLYQKDLGSGSFAKVRLFLELETNRLYAIKSMKKKTLMKKRFGMNHGRTHWDDVMREISILKKLDHPNVIKLKEVLNDPNDDKIHIVMEYAENGPLFQGEDTTIYVRTMDDRSICQILVQIVKGLEYIHSKGVIHRDIKPGNILMGSQGIVKIIDFGVSYVMGSEPASSENRDDSEGLKQTVGSPAFLPPELCANDCSRIEGPPIDVWALGVTIYFLTFGKLPYEGETEALLYDNVRTESVEFPKGTNENLKNLVNSLLTKDPEERITLTQILSHPWVISNS
eukprot:TRINITY_DN13752_c0_g1_i1.p1 TRINITY_DN13752_c0_g1~~TRINITY_DN13752_c0_g1_i1.p1  ORF type:complete len:354 (-),score=98.58 TRINITY_DN13752_c0_g1_i1:244-1305(-)